MAQPSSVSPPPPLDIASRPLPVETIAAGTRLARIHHAEYDPIHFGASEYNRFDNPNGKFGVCYMAKTIKGAFAETFVRAAGDRVLKLSFVQKRSISEVVTTAPLRLSSLHGPGMARVGANSAVSSGSYAVAQSWALALHDHSAIVDGIAYRSKHDDDEISIALFDRARTRISIGGPPQPMIVDLPKFAELCALYDLGLE